MYRVGRRGRCLDEGESKFQYEVETKGRIGARSHPTVELGNSSRRADTYWGSHLRSGQKSFKRRKGGNERNGTVMEGVGDF